jgi:hypothetical protein
MAPCRAHGPILKSDGSMQRAKPDFEIMWRLASLQGQILKPKWRHAAFVKASLIPS